MKINLQPERNNLWINNLIYNKKKRPKELTFDKFRCVKTASNRECIMDIIFLLKIQLKN